MSALSSRSITAVGATPPPVNGMSLFTQKVLELLSAEMEVCHIDLSYGEYSWSRWLRRCRKLSRVLTAIPRVLFRLPSNVGVLYMPLDSRNGLYYGLCIAGIARLRGYRLVVHHHAYTYIDKYDRRMAFINRLIGPQGAHVVHCEQMVDDFCRRYTVESRFFILPPTVVSQASLPSDPSKKDRVLTIGFLSNLVPEKGVEDVLQTFELLSKAGNEVRLIIAGPCIHQQMELKIQEATSRWPEKVEYRGTVYGADKTKYFADIDVFLFPTRYPSESWGIVLEEALNAGCPVIANPLGCIPWIVRDGCGLVVQPEQPFPTVAAKQITDWLENPSEFESARVNAKNRAQSLQENANAAIPLFIQGFLDLLPENPS